MNVWRWLWWRLRYGREPRKMQGRTLGDGLGCESDGGEHVWGPRIWLSGTEYLQDCLTDGCYVQKLFTQVGRPHDFDGATADDDWMCGQCGGTLKLTAAADHVIAQHLR